MKVGSGAFMKNIDEARELAKTMVSIGKNLNRNTIAIITNMDQPLGHEVGNSNEVKEAIKVLSGKGAKDETEVALTIASYMCLLGGAFDDFEQAYKELETKINSGLALEKLKELILIQGGNPEVVDNPDLLPKAKNTFYVYSEVDGYVNKIDAELIGISAMLLGAGRKTKEDSINYGAGISLKKKIGDYVRKGEVLCELHTDFDNVEEATKRINDAYTIKDELPEPKPYVYEVIQ